MSLLASGFLRVGDKRLCAQRRVRFYDRRTRVHLHTTNDGDLFRLGHDRAQADNFFYFKGPTGRRACT
jgi:hypothetical protein